LIDVDHSHGARRCAGVSLGVEEFAGTGSHSVPDGSVYENGWVFTLGDRITS
jgi:hypothetical protein